MAEPWINKKNWLKRYVAPPVAAVEEKKEETIQSINNQPGLYGIIYYPLRCPKCKSKDIKTHTSRPPVRYHKCKKCGFNFRSIEKEA
jgi:predicted RNA-binding Zn-ribbon protein involved in translation (DUF1610 family)